MAKSTRSKWRRKCRAVKRERYAVKELARLKKTLGIDENAPTDANMTELSEIATVTDAKTIKESIKLKEAAAKEIEQSAKMEEDNNRVYNKKTLRDQFGNYPVWMSQAKIAKHKKGRIKSKKATTAQQKRLTRRQKKKAKK